MQGDKACMARTGSTHAARSSPVQRQPLMQGQPECRSAGIPKWGRRNQVVQQPAAAPATQALIQRNPRISNELGCLWRSEDIACDASNRRGIEGLSDEHLLLHWHGSRTIGAAYLKQGARQLELSDRR